MPKKNSASGRRRAKGVLLLMVPLLPLLGLAGACAVGDSSAIVDAGDAGDAADGIVDAADGDASGDDDACPGGGVERCDVVDDDCDGLTDEDSDCAPDCDWPDGVDHGGLDVTIGPGEVWSGRHKRIRTFAVPAGVTLSVAPSDGSTTTGWLDVCAQAIVVDGVISASASGHAAGQGPWRGVEGPPGPDGPSECVYSYGWRARPGYSGYPGWRGGYATVESWGDLTTDDSVWLGSGGGPGGRGGNGGSATCCGLRVTGADGGDGGGGGRGGGAVAPRGATSIAVAGEIRAAGEDGSAGSLGGGWGGGDGCQLTDASEGCDPCGSCGE